MHQPQTRKRRYWVITQPHQTGKSLASYGPPSVDWATALQLKALITPPPADHAAMDDMAEWAADAGRANRIPRMAQRGQAAAVPTRPGLMARLRRWLRLRQLRAHYAWLDREARELQHHMALDQAAAQAHRLHYTRSPVLAHRMAQDREQYQTLLAQLASVARELRAMGEVL